MRSSACWMLAAAIVTGGAGGAVAGDDAPGDEAAELFRDVLSSSVTLRGLAAEPERYRMQILFAEIVDGGAGVPTLRRYGYRENAEYWYPASTVKVCAAVAALLELRGLDPAGEGWPRPDTPMVYGPQFGAEGPESEDPANTRTGMITVETDIRHALVVSDNPAYNRLYELAGPERINTLLRGAGLASTTIVHRLAESRSAAQNRELPRVAFSGDGGAVVREAFVCGPTEPWAGLASMPGAPDMPIGRARLAGGEVVPGPMRFAGKNFISLRDLQSLVAMIVRPDIDLGQPGLGLADGERELLVAAMTDFPSESENPAFDPERFTDEWPHFFLPGLERVAPRDELRIANKIGLAYGFTSETAYIEHVPTGRAFFLAMCLYTNDNAVLNDGVYEYDVAFRSMEDVAEALARRVFDVPAADDQPDAVGLIEAPSLWAHQDIGVHQRSDPALVLAPGTERVLPTIRPERPFTEMVVSWNVDAPAGAGARLEARVSGDGASWSEWVALAETGDFPPRGEWVTEAGGVRADVDTLVADRPRSHAQLRVRVPSGASGVVTIHRLDACVSSLLVQPARVRDERLDGAVVAETPYRPNTVEDPTLRSRLCSPLSVRMLLAARGVEVPLGELMERIHDGRHDLYGNWPSAIQAAHELGVPGALTRFSDWASVRRHLETVGPMAISLRFEEGEVANAPYGTGGGHIIVVYGLDDRGDVMVLDPALSPESEARRVYGRDELSEVWLRRVKGLAFSVGAR